MTTAGQMIRKARERRKLTRPQVAKKIGVSEGYVGHLERDSHVHISPRLVLEFRRKLGLSLPRSTVERANAAARRWYRRYHLSKA